MNPKITTDRAGLMDFVHDRWFDLEAMRFDATLRELTIQLGNNRRGPYTDWLLRITDVSSVSVVDDEKVGIYDVEEIRIGLLEDTITIIGGVPVTITVQVGSACELSITAMGSA